MSDETLEIHAPDEPALIVTTGRHEWFLFADGRPLPEITGLAAAVLVTRLRWWADRIERSEFEAELGAVRSVPQRAGDA